MSHSNCNSIHFGKGTRKRDKKGTKAFYEFFKHTQMRSSVYMCLWLSKLFLCTRLIAKLMMFLLCVCYFWEFHWLLLFCNAFYIIITLLHIQTHHSFIFVLSQLPSHFGTTESFEVLHCCLCLRDSYYLFLSRF